MLKITNLSVLVGQKPILNHINLEIEPGSVHVLMGPNGSGKSTLAAALMGHPDYEISQGSIILNGQEITHFALDKRAQAGIFLAFQNPLEIPGLTIFNFIKEAHYATTKKLLSISEFQGFLFEKMDILGMDHAIAYRNVNAGFSGGEKKRLEILQLLMLCPQVAILDEIDSGLDVDAIKIVAQGIQAARRLNPCMSILMITHYPRLLEHIKPDWVHVLGEGTIKHQGPLSLAYEIEQRGYDARGS